MEYEPSWRLNMSDICRNFYNLSKKYQNRSFSSYDTQFSGEITECLNNEDYDENASLDDGQSNQSSIPSSYITITILNVDDAIRMHKSKNGNKQLAWQSFKHHSSTNIEAKYSVG